MLPPSLPPQAGWLHQCEGRPPPTHTHSSLSAYFVINRLQHAATAAASIYSTQAAIFPTALVMPAQRYHRVVRRTSRKTVVPVSQNLAGNKRTTGEAGIATDGVMAVLVVSGIKPGLQWKLGMLHKSFGFPVVMPSGVRSAHISSQMLIYEFN